MHKSTDMYIEMPLYQSTDAIRKRHLYIHISRLMQSENGILLLCYIFLSHGNEIIFFSINVTFGNVNKQHMLKPRNIEKPSNQIQLAILLHVMLYQVHHTIGENRTHNFSGDRH